jgi:5-methyltetrahydropteroyltriglutamate--homocysteine methyltransferase
VGPQKLDARRILTTHTGSLPRPADLVQRLYERERQRAPEADPAFEQQVAAAVRDVVARQREAGIDIVSDGEMGKVAYSTYVTQRLTGFEGEPIPRPANIDRRAFPGFEERPGPTAASMRVPSCNGPISWRGDAQVQRDIANIKAAIGSSAAAPRDDVFLTAASPGVVWYFLSNAYYPSHEAYIGAIAEAMRHEYRAIHEAGLLLQLDCPDLAGGWNRADLENASLDDFRKLIRLHIEALNHAVADIPPERMRMHVCWGNYNGPHLRDIPLREILEVLLTARPRYLSFEGANPRHEHEWAVFEEIKLPDDKVILPGVLDSTTNFVEHPELIAQRIRRYARIVGPQRVIASSDCGFSTFAGSQSVHPLVTWKKLEALSEGARLAGTG